MRWPHYAPGWKLWERSAAPELRPAIARQAQSWVMSEERVNQSP